MFPEASSSIAPTADAAGSAGSGWTVPLKAWPAERESRSNNPRDIGLVSHVRGRCSNLGTTHHHAAPARDARHGTGTRLRRVANREPGTRGASDGPASTQLLWLPQCRREHAQHRRDRKVQAKSHEPGAPAEEGVPMREHEKGDGGDSGKHAGEHTAHGDTFPVEAQHHAGI